MKHFIIEILYKVDVGQLGETVSEHREFLQIGYDQGWLLCSGPQEPKIGGVIVAKAPSIDFLRTFFKDDPYHKKELASYKFIEFTPVKYQPFLLDWIEGSESK